MTMAQKIKMALAYAGLSEAELARRLDMSPQALHQRIKTGNLPLQSLKALRRPWAPAILSVLLLRTGPQYNPPPGSLAASLPAHRKTKTPPTTFL